MAYYFSEREFGECGRDTTEISKSVWDGLAQIIASLVDDGSLGSEFPEYCNDHPSLCCGTSMHKISVAMKAEIPALAAEYPDLRLSIELMHMPSQVTMMDIVEFFWRNVGKPTRVEPHQFLGHYHYWSFDVPTGQLDFRRRVNMIFGRNGIRFNLSREGNIERVPSVELAALFPATDFETGDAELDTMIDTARRRFLARDKDANREALEKIFDAWERIKTIRSNDKKSGAEKMLDSTVSFPASQFRAWLGREARELTWAGNQFQIRHSEMDQERLEASAHVDYVFYRVLSLINLILASGYANRKTT